MNPEVTCGADAGQSERFHGGFALGSMQLALPMSALREVVRLGPLDPLPCAAACVLGGFDLRGAMIPVVDLRILLEREHAGMPDPCIVVLVHAGRLLGLLAERVTGIFTAAPGSFHGLTVAHGAGSVLAGSVIREDDGSLVTVLDPALLATLPHVPLADDPQAGAESVAADGSTGFDAGSKPLMLLRCRRVAMAIDSLIVHSTLAHPAIHPGPIAMDDCCGTIEYTGRRIGAVDLLSLCGFGRIDIHEPIHAFVVQLKDGFVAFLVDAVIDVIRVRVDQIVPVANYALPEPALFSGSLPKDAVTPVFTASADPSGVPISQYLLLDTGTLMSSPLVQALSATNVPMAAEPVAPGTRPSSRASGAVSAPGSVESAAVITFDWVGETAAPLEQIVEILPYHPDSTAFAADSPLLGLIVNRGRSIPLFCLRRLGAAESAPVTAESRVLVVQSGAECVGFVVARVRSIETSSWRPLLPGHGGPAAEGLPSSVAQVLNSQRLAMIGAGTGERLLRLLNLESLARALDPHREALSA